MWKNPAMTVPLIDLQTQYRSIQTEIDNAIRGVLNEASFIGGYHVQQFEEAFAEFSGAKRCVGCANGTDAIELALKACGVGPGDEVLVPANTWISSAEAATNIGARPVFVDCDPKRYTIDVSAIEKHITPRTRAIIPVHLYGLPADMDPILAIARQYGLFVIEDCAQAHAAEYRGRPVGTMGHCGTFSFFPGKNLGAYGDAGGVITNDDELATQIRLFANHGRLSKFDHACEGRNSRLDALQAAILSVKLPYLSKWTEARRVHAETYTRLLTQAGVVVPTVPADVRHVYHLYVVQVAARNECRRILEEGGVSTGIHYPYALPYTQAYANRGHTPDDYPVAHSLMSRILSLPIYPELTRLTIETICDLLTRATATTTTVSAA